MAGGNAPGSPLRDIRCAWKKHFEVEQSTRGIARVLCRECGRKRRAVVVHYFDLATGVEVETKVYQDLSELFEAKRRERVTSEKERDAWPSVNTRSA